MYTDIHSHVIWGVDDGAETEEETKKLLHEAVEDGIGRIICTPHITPGVYEFPEEEFKDHFQRAEEYIREENLPLQIYPGAEILYTDSTPRMIREQRIPTLAGTKYVLVEFSQTDSWQHIRDALQKIAGTGLTPVIAHMERYPAISKTEQLREIKERLNTLIQINARTLTYKLPLLRRRFFDELFTQKYCDFIATDTHALPGRKTCMTQGFEALRKKYGEDIAIRLDRKPDLFFE